MAEKDRAFALKAEIDSLNDNVGDLSDLETSDRTSIVDAINEIFGNISSSAVSDLNSVPTYKTGIEFFCFTNTSSNRPKTAGGAGIYLANWNYGVMIVFSNSSSGSTLSYRSCSSVSTTPSFSAWKDISAS